MPPSIAKRLLFPAQQSEQLPPLLASNVPNELNAELYDFIALALRAFVTPWWSKISRYDKDFLPEITRILSHVFRALESRLLAADLPPLILQDIPVIITQHYRDYRNVKLKQSTSYAQGGSYSVPRLFHQFQPHLAVSSEGRLDEEYYRHLFDFVLKTLLPPEDYAPEAERTIVREIILKVVLQDVIPKISQPWFLLKAVSDSLDQRGVPSSKPIESAPLKKASSPLSFHTLIVLVLSAIQTMSGLCLTLIESYKRAAHTIKLVNQSHAARTSLSDNSNIPTPPLSPSTSLSDSSSILPPSPSSASHRARTAEDMAQPGLVMFSEIIQAEERYASRLLLNSASMVISSFTAFIDRFLLYVLRESLSSPNLTLNVVRILKRTMFPNGYPVPAPPPPTLEEQAAMRERIIRFTPPRIMPLLLGPDPAATISDILDPLSDQTCNLHLIVLLVDRILLALLPELAAQMDTL